MHRIIHTFKKNSYNYLFNRIFYVAVALLLQLGMAFDHRMEAGSIFKIYFKCDCDHQHSGRTLDRKQKDQSIL